MSAISDLIMQQVKSAVGNVEIPTNVSSQVVNGLSDSILGSLTQTATKAGGLDAIKGLLTGKSDAASSPITKLAGSLFKNNVLSKLNLGSGTSSALAGLIPGVLGNLKNFIKDQDGDGDVDLNDVLATLTGGKGAGSLLGVAGKLLGGFLKKR